MICIKCEASIRDTVTEESIVAELLDMARSANVHFELVQDRLTIRAVNPRWEMWRPFRHILDEIGTSRIETYLRRRGGHPD